NSGNYTQFPHAPYQVEKLPPDGIRFSTPKKPFNTLYLWDDFKKKVPQTCHTFTSVFRENSGTRGRNLLSRTYLDTVLVPALKRPENRRCRKLIYSSHLELLKQEYASDMIRCQGKMSDHCLGLRSQVASVIDQLSQIFEKPNLRQ